MKTYNEFVSEGLSEERKRFKYGTTKPDWSKLISHKYKDDVKSAVYDYVMGYTTSVNNYLRGGLDGVCEPVTTALDKAFKTKGKIDVYRTTDNEYLKNIYGFDTSDPEKIVGTVITNKGYMSTTYDRQSPWSKYWSDNETVLHITSDKLVPYININNTLDADDIDCEDQNECLLPRNLSMVVTGVKRVTKSEDHRFSDKGNFIIDLKIV